MVDVSWSRGCEFGLSSRGTKRRTSTVELDGALERDLLLGVLRLDRGSVVALGLSVSRQLLRSQEPLPAGTHLVEVGDVGLRGASRAKISHDLGDEWGKAKPRLGRTRTAWCLVWWSVMIADEMAGSRSCGRRGNVSVFGGVRWGRRRSSVSSCESSLALGSARLGQATGRSRRDQTHGVAVREGREDGRPVGPAALNQHHSRT